jgi:outer membrane protein TolC
MIHKIIIVIGILSLVGIGVQAQETYTLEKCKELALKNNVKALNGQLALESARETKKEAVTKYFPSVSTTGAGFKATDPMMEMELQLGAMMGNPAIPPVELGMLKKGIIGMVTASQPVFAGGQIINGNKLAKTGVEVAELQKTMGNDEVLLTVEQYYWQIVALEEKVKTIAEAETLLNSVYQDVNNYYNGGLVNKTDLLKVQLKQRELESGKLKLINGLKLSKIALAQYIGVPSENFEIDTTLLSQEILTLSLPANHQAALQQRVEYQLLEKNIEVNKLQVSMEVGKNLPTIAIGAGWNYMSFDKGSSMAMKTDFGMGFATISIPISNWWSGSHSIKKQKTQVKIAENERRNAGEMILIQMQQLWNELDEAWLLVQLAERTIDSALENVRLNTDYYEAGTGILTDLLDAQNVLQQAHDQHTEALALYRIKLSKYKQATGQ